MKKIILLLIVTLLIVSCGWKEPEIKNHTNNIEDVKTDNNMVVLTELINKQEFDKAIIILEKNYKDNPEEIKNIMIYVWTLANMGTILREEAKYSKMIIEIVEKWIQLYPENSELYRVLWYAYEIIEDYEKAFLNYNKSIELDPNNVAAYTTRGHAFRLIWKFEEAENDFKKAYQLDETISENLVNLATMYLYKWEVDKAYNMYEESLKNTENIRYKSEALSAMWEISRSKEDFKWAVENFKKAIKEDPEFELGYLWLWHTYLWEYKNLFKSWNPSIELLQEAENSIKISIEKNPNKAMSYVILWGIYFDLWEMEIASEYIKKGEDKVKNDITLGKIEKEEAMKDIQSIKEAIITFHSFF